MSERTVLVVVSAEPDAFGDFHELVEETLNEDFLESVAIVRCSDATAEALLDSLEDEVTVGPMPRVGPIPVTDRVLNEWGSS